nr:beta-1,3-N-acetylglucosaminyltransferase radical fringe [Nothobranchius furzeri]XP_015796308.2 beta-1,3-N-acetylglucosaminyltransferase radical fringe [Nothobranchius furzeri]XP_015796310.2 beta-1,3-N-acetylglucosaminyltransferase radical fringe [Nothobranchius furzeri]XP_015796311.2 beta-1,3-N-acetylglucosaminyltransferase radical fringe [Nothobranchius furzeri]XP_054592370.1 beta-1,3-N-acetylglucosaminyltransferase radical fringe [Nothobranchius furzeri]XP_054592371.1 beta-1,3-N-acetylglu
MTPLVWPGRMHMASVGISKFCFLFSVAFCSLLLLLIPALQSPPSQLDLPRPRPRTRLPPAHRTHRARLPTSTASPLRNLETHGPPTRTQLSGRKSPSQLAGSREDLRGSDGRRMGSLMGYRSPDTLELRDIFIAVKTTRKYHESRLQLLLQTWVSRAKEQTFIFTDAEDRELQLRAGVNIINTNCSAAHNRQALCCKMSVEYDKFIESQKKWFCHVDDDNYVVLPSLLRLLSSYHHSQDLYLGRPSLDHPIEAAERIRSDGSVSVKFWFATGGAGFCISRGLALKMSPWASLGNFISTAEKIRLPDDCTIGYIIEALLEVKLTRTHLFHSHLENLRKLPPDSVLGQVTLSYGGLENRRNVLSVVGNISLAEDPTRFKTVHCLLYPDTEWCPSIKA